MIGAPPAADQSSRDGSGAAPRSAPSGDPRLYDERVLSALRAYLARGFPALSLEDREDILHDVQHRLANHAHAADTLLGYLWRTARNAALSWARRQGVQHRVYALVAQRPSRSEGEHDAFAQAHDVAWALGRCTERERTVARLVFWEGLTQREAAECLGVTEKTVNNRLRSLKKRLRTLLA